jgi:hypothetical protein
MWRGIVGLLTALHVQGHEPQFSLSSAFRRATSYSRSSESSWGADPLCAFRTADGWDNSKPVFLFKDSIGPANPYANGYASRAEATNACQAAGFHGLCNYQQLFGYEHCMCSWIDDRKTRFYWMTAKGAASTYPDCGHAGYNNCGRGSRGQRKGGAHCCMFAPAAYTRFAVVSNVTVPLVRCQPLVMSHCML